MTFFDERLDTLKEQIAEMSLERVGDVLVINYPTGEVVKMADVWVIRIDDFSVFAVNQCYLVSEAPEFIEVRAGGDGGKVGLHIRSIKEANCIEHYLIASGIMAVQGELFHECPECYGTGFLYGFGAPCSKGCGT